MSKTNELNTKEYLKPQGTIQAVNKTLEEILEQNKHQAAISMALEMDKNFKLYSYRIISKEVFIQLTQTLIDEFQEICSAG